MRRPRRSTGRADLGLFADWARSARFDADRRPSRAASSSFRRWRALPARIGTGRRAGPGWACGLDTTPARPGAGDARRAWRSARPRWCRRSRMHAAVRRRSRSTAAWRATVVLPVPRRCNGARAERVHRARSHGPWHRDAGRRRGWPCPPARPARNARRPPAAAAGLGGTLCRGATPGPGLRRFRLTGQFSFSSSPGRA